MNDFKKAKNGIFFGLLNNAMCIILPFISRTIIIYKLGIEYVGLGSLFNSILQVLSLGELGIGATISYTLYKPIADKNVEKVNAILNFYKKIYIFIGAIISLVAILIFPFLNLLIKGDIPNDININILYLIYVLNTVASYFFFAYRKVLFSASQRYDIELKINTITIVVQYLLQIVLMLFFKNYYIYVLVILFMTIINNMLSYYVTRNKYSSYICRGKLEKSEIKNIVKLTGGSFFGKIGSIIYLSVDTIVISSFLGLKLLGLYNNYYYVINMLISVFAIIHNTMRPIIGRRLMVNDLNGQWKDFRIFNSLYMFLVIFCSSCMLSLYQDFEYLWCGSVNMLDFALVVLLVIYFYCGRSYCVLELYQEAAGLMWKGRYVPLLSGLLNLTINLIFVKKYGLYGIILSSILSSLIISIPGYITIVFSNIFNKVQRNSYIKQSFLFVLQASIICILCYFFTNQLTPNNWLLFILKAILVAIISAVSIVLINQKNDVVKYSVEYLSQSIWNRK